jgi:hypothetical protein
MDLPIRCGCGALRGVLRSVSPRSRSRVICYCDDCQCFAHFLERADSILDAHGGTDIFQTSPARLELTAGEGQLACMRLTPGSNTVRWYARCCRTPIGNTPADHRVPVVGLIRSCIDVAATGLSADEVLGPVRGRVFRRFAHGVQGQLAAPDGLPALQILRVVRMVVAARLRRDQLRSPFLRPNGELTVAPRVLGADELQVLRGRLPAP